MDEERTLMEERRGECEGVVFFQVYVGERDLYQAWELVSRLLEGISKNIARSAVECLVFWCVGSIPPGHF